MYHIDYDNLPPACHFFRLEKCGIDCFHNIRETKMNTRSDQNKKPKALATKRFEEILANRPDPDINYREVANDVRRLCNEIVKDYQALAAAEEVSNQLVAESATASCHVCQLELDPKELGDHLQIHARAAALETYKKKKAELAALKQESAKRNKQVATESAARRAEEKARKAEEEARNKAEAEDASLKKLAEARARRNKKMKKPVTEIIPEKIGKKFTVDYEIDKALKETAMKESSLSEKKGKRKGKGKGGSKPDAVQKNSQSEQTAGQNLNKNVEQVTENAVEGCNKTNTKQVEQTLNRKTTEGSAEKVCVGTGNSKIKSKDMPTPTDEEEMISPTDEEGKKSSKMKKRLDLRHNRKQAKGSSDSDETNDKRVIEEQNFSDSSEETGETSSFVLTEALLLELNSLQETIAQVLSNESEIQKKILDAVELHISSEGSRLESTIIKSFEELDKASCDAYWACLQERFALQEKLNLERNQQDMTSASITRHEFYQAFEQMLKNELNAVVLGVEEIIQKAVPKAVTNAFQGFIGDEAVNHLLNADVEAIVSRNVQQQIQTSGKQAIKDAFRSSLKDSVIPAFEMSCKTLSTQVVAEFNNRISELKDAAQQKFESTHSPLGFKDKLHDSCHILII